MPTGMLDVKVGKVRARQQSRNKTLQFGGTTGATLLGTHPGYRQKEGAPFALCSSSWCPSNHAVAQDHSEQSAWC